MRFYAKGIGIFVLVLMLALLLIASQQLYLQWANSQLSSGLILIMNLRSNIQPRDATGPVATASSVERDYQELRKLATDGLVTFAPPGVTLQQNQYQTVVDAGAAAAAQAVQAFGQHNLVAMEQADAHLLDVADQMIKVRRRLVQDGNQNNVLIAFGMEGLFLLTIITIIRTMPSRPA
ncbi:MAG: hypothetical protein M3Z04_19230 [Chloroflexota bacterium]|nr:hypothetical protein [Chloroflexota bacterium]